MVTFKIFRVLVMHNLVLLSLLSNFVIITLIFIENKKHKRMMKDFENVFIEYYNNMIKNKKEFVE